VRARTPAAGGGGDADANLRGDFLDTLLTIAKGGCYGSCA